MRIIFESDEEAQTFLNERLLPLTKALGSLEHQGSPHAQAVGYLHDCLHAHYWDHYRGRIQKTKPPAQPIQPSPPSPPEPLSWEKLKLLGFDHIVEMGAICVCNLDMSESLTSEGMWIKGCSRTVNGTDAAADEKARTIAMGVIAKKFKDNPDLLAQTLARRPRRKRDGR